MGKLRRFSGRDICKLLGQNGFANVRQRGSHIVMQKRTGISTITVPVPNHREIKIGTLQAIIRQSKVAHELFES